MQTKGYQRRDLREIGAELQRLDERLAGLNRALAQDDFDDSLDARDELAPTRVALLHASTGITRAERRI